MVGAVSVTPVTSAPVGVFRSPLPGVPDRAWRRLVRVLEVQGVGETSGSGGLGAFDVPARRLVELGLASGLRHEATPAGGYRRTCDFAPAIKGLLSDPFLQYGVLSFSLSRYDENMRVGRIKRPVDLSRAGALALLHRGGRGALAAWPDLYPKTAALVERARSAF